MSQFGRFLQNLRNLGLEFFDRYYSVYAGIVTNNNDPEKRGRIKVKIPSLLGEQELVQWVIPISNHLAGNQTGSFFPPYVNDVVKIMFEFGDLDYPVYMGGFWAKEELPESFQEDYPNIKGFTFKSGQKILIKEKSSKLEILLSNSDNQFIKISKENDEITIESKKVKINADEIEIGNNANFHSVIYENLKSLLAQHTHATPVGPTSPMIPPFTFDLVEANPQTSPKADKIKILGNL